MLQLIPDMPAGVVGVETQGKVTASDYEQVLVPAFDAAVAAAPDGKVRILYVLGSDTPDLTAGAAWQDTKLGLGHIRSWERIALVTDADWIRRSVQMLDWMIPGETRVFPMEDRDAARSWLTS